MVKYSIHTAIHYRQRRTDAEVAAIGIYTISLSYYDHLCLYIFHDNYQGEGLFYVERGT